MPASPSHPTDSGPRSLRLALVAIFAVGLPGSATAAVPEKAVDLRARGLAELENERPERAEAIYRELVELVPGDPLPHANLAIALLRRQQHAAAAESIVEALKRDPGRGELLAIEAEIAQWSGELERALELYRTAADAAPQDLEILYGLYQIATTVRSEAAEQAATEAMKRLARLRPENVVILLQLGQRAVGGGDRFLATAVFNRLSELLWQAEPVAERALESVLEPLRSGELAAAEVPARRLENVLKITPMFRESLRELKTGIQGVPLLRFREEPAPTAFGEPLELAFAGTVIDPRPTVDGALAVADLDGDERPDIARVREGGVVEIRPARSDWGIGSEHPIAGATALLAADLDNDGSLDLVVIGTESSTVLLGGDGAFRRASLDLGLSSAGAVAAEVIDFDIEGDLDLALAGGSTTGLEIYRNTLAGPLEPVGQRVLPKLALTAVRALRASDLDRDGDLDLLVGHGRGLTWLDNLRQGRFRDRTAEAGLGAAAVAAMATADLDNDGRPDVVAGGSTLEAWRNLGERFESWPLAGLSEAGGDLLDLQPLDADNDGRLDLAVAGAAGVTVLGQRAAGFRAFPLSGGPSAASAVAAADLDGDGDLDLVAAGAHGLHRLENRGGHRNGWLAVGLRGLQKGNGKNNRFGTGSVVEVRNGLAYQFREARGDVVHLGLGRHPSAEVLRVVWTNGVPQNRLEVAGKQRIVEEQLLKGSCPFLYAWDGGRFAFVTDLLWGSPLGLPFAPGVWAPSDPVELVRVDGLSPSGGLFDLRITEELWEAAFFDAVRLWVVDHPADVEVASALKILPGAVVGEEVLASRRLRPVAAALDGRGRDVTDRIRRRDDVYADGYSAGPYQGLAAEPWRFTFDLGVAPDTPVRLHLDGWIFPTDASINLAVAQRSDLAPQPPRLEVETASGWQLLMSQMGYPAGKTKTMIIDTPPLPPGSQRLRIVTNLWLHWDRVAWTTARADDEVDVRARLEPHSATLRYRGFSRLRRAAPNAPHTYAYDEVTAASPWLALPGRYTRYGDVRDLLLEPDDRSVILAAGDELAVSFDATGLEPPRAGWVRTLFLESHGWDKDADRNTFEGHRLEPLPFRAMSGYPFAAGERFPDDDELRRYREEWLTRQVPPAGR